MKYQPLNDLIDPDVPADAPVPEPEQDPDAPEDAYVIGERWSTVQEPGAETTEGKKKRKRKKGKTRAWVKPVAILSAVACVALTAWNLSKLAQGSPAPPPPSPFQMKQALYMGAIKVEAYRREHGVTPGTIADIGLVSPPYSYTRLNPDAYIVAVDLHGAKLEYESSVPLEKFFGTPGDMLNTERTQ
jgi:hypothetical protein